MENNNISVRRIAVLGAGESGTGAAILAKDKGFDVFVSDFGKIPDKYKEMLNREGIEWEEDKHTFERILAADEIIKSPGIADSTPIMQKILSKKNPRHKRNRVCRTIHRRKNDMYYRQ